MPKGQCRRCKPIDVPASLHQNWQALTQQHNLSRHPDGVLALERCGRNQRCGRSIADVLWPQLQPACALSTDEQPPAPMAAHAHVTQSCMPCRVPHRTAAAAPAARPHFTKTPCGVNVDTRQRPAATPARWRSSSSSSSRGRRATV
jgi:hypothetical protein